MRIIFIGGFFHDNQRDFIIDNSIGVIQNAADAFQTSLLTGARKKFDGDIICVNLPFIGGYPFRFKKIFFPKMIFKDVNYTVLGASFINISFFKILFRFISCLCALFKISATDKKNDIVMVYSAHMPFMMAAFIYKVLKPSSKICIILPDLPEFMGGQGFLHSVLKKIETGLFYWLVKKFDFHVVLTQPMIHRIGVDERKAIVVEGILTKNFDVSIKSKSHQEVKTFLYSGTLARRYGIVQLVDAFQKIKSNDCRLLICGDGDSRDEIIAATKSDARINYLGQVSRKDAIILQRDATFLVNPRMNDDFTKFSFPSKIIEYMNSGRVVIMFKLTGIPEEYFKYCITPSSESVDSLSNAMVDAMGMGDEEVTFLGNKARDFVVGTKSDEIQFGRILKLISGDDHV